MAVNDKLPITSQNALHSIWGLVLDLNSQMPPVAKHSIDLWARTGIKQRSKLLASAAMALLSYSLFQIPWHPKETHKWKRNTLQSLPISDSFPDIVLPPCVAIPKPIPSCIIPRQIHVIPATVQGDTGRNRLQNKAALGSKPILSHIMLFSFSKCGFCIITPTVTEVHISPMHWKQSIDKW